MTSTLIRNADGIFTGLPGDPGLDLEKLRRDAAGIIKRIAV